MITWNGWYSTKYLDIVLLKNLYNDALNLSTKSICDVKNDRYTRTLDSTITPKEWIETYLTRKNHNTVCNRFEYNKGQPWNEPIGEIGSCTLGLKYDKFLWIYVSLEDLEILVKKYRLNKR